MFITFDYDVDKALAAISFLGTHNLPELSKGKIIKLLFLADRAHVVRFGRPIIGDRHCALEHGPILSKTLDLMNRVESGDLADESAFRLSDAVDLDRRFTHPHYSCSKAVELDALSHSDVTVLEEVVAKYGQNTFKELRNVTHDFCAYKNAWNSRLKEASAADMRFEDLFADEDVDDIVEGARDEMVENAQLAEALSGQHY